MQDYVYIYLCMVTHYLPINVQSIIGHAVCTREGRRGGEMGGGGGGGRERERERER